MRNVVVEPFMALKKKRSDHYVIIMAGGRGERFWPISRNETPKQLISLLGKKSFLQQAVDRVLPLVPIENLLVITNEAQSAQVRKQLPQMPKANVVSEPVGRDTCAAVALGAAIVGARSRAATMAVLPADHVIPEEKEFRQVLKDSLYFASQEAAMVTIGIQPTEPATGYGYIQMGKAIRPGAARKEIKTSFFEAKRFVEKPPLETAQEYLASGQYRWNAGMFIWSWETITNGFRQHVPEMAEACERWCAAASSQNRLTQVLTREYPAIRKISIDFALMEKASNVVVAGGDFAWDDLGAWPALARHIKADKEGNCVVADCVHVDAARNIVFDARKKKKTPIALVGLQDCIIVHTDDALLVAGKQQAQKIKELVKKLGSSRKYKQLV